MTVFHSLADALKAGYAVYDRTATGYVVRQRVDGLWRMALVELPPKKV